ncbi:uncharacterized protein LOC129800280 isoform X2 [Phlebotomus papatasi]|nr:uncharacterized protein LOC129800280 isoform X2 [Phlebotomus papatasi]
MIHVSPKLSPKISNPIYGHRVELEHSTHPSKTFVPSVGSDDTSNRESECSGERSPISPICSMTIGVPKTTLYDSLAAELRAKLNGKGPPILLPPRDYDTVHRSKGNLAATELRRCQNQSIVGGPDSGKQGVSSRGSSGIGSDLAPSPERQDIQISSDDDWTNDHQESIIIMQAPRRPAPDNLTPIGLSTQRPITTYLYPDEAPRNDQFVDNHNVLLKHRIIPLKAPAEERRRSDSSQSREDEVKPILTKNRHPYNESTRFREVFDQGKNYAVELKKNQFSEDEKDVLEKDEIERPVRRVSSTKTKEIDFKFRENLTDKQKYMAEKCRQNCHRGRLRSDQMDNMIEKMENVKYREEKPRYKLHLSEKSSNASREKSVEISKYGDFAAEDGIERNPYHELESQPYRESIEKMIKSPVMRYKSFDDSKYHLEIIPMEETWNDKKSYLSQKRYHEDVKMYQYAQEEFKPSRRDYVIEGKKVSPKERFYNAREKFKAMECGVHKPSRSYDVMASKRESLDPSSRHSLQHLRSSPILCKDDWSSDEDLSLQNISVPTYRDHEPPRMISRNLVKGYRHSYAEPRNPMPRTPCTSGRVGLAAVNHY